ncbi:membrane hypothetical protein [Candidatus Xenohaliotis californiensis]|uniref:Uncharacterized protein n=1 Tax=Candidatus Xenohaliotis californiensis TaxID=84677 RepID=A0ABM9N7M3_9RICK|nr:membrane hypothetical protein [Candidatus Xenohaliotis californiensis]
MSIDNMHIYYVFHKTGSENNGYGSISIVQDGFSMYAFLFNVLWVFYKKMWAIGILLLVALAAVDWLMHYFWNYTYFHYTILHLWFMFTVGVMGNIFISWHLYIKGYSMKTVIIGRDELEVARSFLTMLTDNSNIS